MKKHFDKTKFVTKKHELVGKQNFNVNETRISAVQKPATKFLGTGRPKSVWCRY
jgi:hypothetical protein